MKRKNIDDYWRQHGDRQRYVMVDQQQYGCDDLKREDHPQVMQDIKGAQTCPAMPPGGGRGMKFRKP